MQCEALKAENDTLQQTISIERNGANIRNSYSIKQEQDPIAIFEQKLKGVIAATRDLTRPVKNLESTLELW